jgi:hypothetical protein
MAFDLKHGLSFLAFALIAGTSAAEQGPGDMPADLRDKFTSEQFAQAVWLDCTSGSERMKFAMRLLAQPDTDYGAVHHVLTPFAADGSALGLVNALSDWVEGDIDPEQIAQRFRLQCIELAAAEGT